MNNCSLYIYNKQLIRNEQYINNNNWLFNYISDDDIGIVFGILF